MINLIIAALATVQIVAIWRTSSLFANARSITDMWDNKIGELLACGFCLSIWVGVLSLLPLELQRWGLAPGVASQAIAATAFAVKALAAARLANFIYDAHKIGIGLLNDDTESDLLALDFDGEGNSRGLDEQEIQAIFGLDEPSRDQPNN